MQDEIKITNIKLYVIANKKNDKKYIVEAKLTLKDGTSKYTYYSLNQPGLLKPISVTEVVILLTNAKEIKQAKPENIKNSLDKLEVLITNTIIYDYSIKSNPYNEDKKYLNEMLLKLHYAFNNLDYGFNNLDYGFNNLESRKVL